MILIVMDIFKEYIFILIILEYQPTILLTVCYAYKIVLM